MMSRRSKMSKGWNTEPRRMHFVPILPKRLLIRNSFRSARCEMDGGAGVHSRLIKTMAMDALKSKETFIAIKKIEMHTVIIHLSDTHNQSVERERESPTFPSRKYLWCWQSLHHMQQQQIRRNAETCKHH